MGNRKPSVGVSFKNRAGVGRADLIRIYREYGEDGLLHGAEAAGFRVKKEEKSVEKHDKASRGVEHKEEGFVSELEHSKYSALDGAPPMDFWIPTTYVESPEREHKRPKTAVAFKPDNSDIKGDHTIVPPETKSLIPWSRMWPFLFKSLSLPREFARVDEGEAVKRISSGTPLRSIPFKKKVTWVQSSQIILDFNNNLTPLWDEISGLYNSLEKIRGKFGLEVLQTESMPEGPYINKGVGHSYRVPEQGSPIFIISDLGYYDKPGKRRRAWILFGKRLRRAGFKPVVLVPCTKRIWDEDLTKYFYHVCWDRGEGALTICHKDKVQLKNQNYDDSVYDEIEERLLSLISPALAVEPGLLRTLRYQLPLGKSDIGTEMSVWNSEKVKTGPLHCELKTIYIEKYRSRFKEDKELKDNTVSYIKEYHRHYPKPVQALEERIAGYLDCQGSGHEEYIWRHIATIDDDSYPYKGGMRDFINRNLYRMCAEMVGGDYALAICWAKSNRELLLAGSVKELPHWMKMEEIEWALAEKLEPESWIMLQSGEELILKKKALFLEDVEAQRRQMLFAPDSPIASFTLSRWFVTIRRSGANEGSELIDVRNVDSVSYKPEDSGGLTFETDHESITIDTRQRGEEVSVIGRDMYGLYEEVGIKGVVQRFRYIPPGRFLMGSPTVEAERRDNETLHEVILTRGYWLADTACTQELWEAVMGENPREFKEGKDLPVEKVSWDMCKEFLEKINEQKPELDLRLPTEAEWEYACRAGTNTPFSFGNDLATDKVNYDGNYPYKGGKKGEYRKKTVEVRSFTRNKWGLYEMHGNVWEWCEDWYGDYGSDKVVDPKGAYNGEYRVLRGGSWNISGGWCRSAYRFGGQPDFRSIITGFRLARGQ